MCVCAFLRKCEKVVETYGGIMRCTVVWSVTIRLSFDFYPIEIFDIFCWCGPTQIGCFVFVCICVRCISFCCSAKTRTNTCAGKEQCNYIRKQYRHTATLTKAHCARLDAHQYPHNTVAVDYFRLYCTLSVRRLILKCVAMLLVFCFFGGVHSN